MAKYDRILHSGWKLGICHLALSLVHAFSGSLCAQESLALANASSAVDDIELEVVKLVRKLGSKSFSTREAAASGLLELGEPGLPALHRVILDSGLKLEVKNRLYQVLDQLESKKFERLSKSFLLDADPTNSYGLPAWSQYSDVVGTSRTGKMLYLDMLREQPEIMKLVEQLGNSNRPEDRQKMRAACLQLADDLQNRRMSRAEYPHIGDVLALLFATTAVEGNTPNQVNDFLLSSIRMTPVSSYMQRRGHGAAIRTLYDSWLPKVDEAHADSALYSSLGYDLAAGAVVARRHLNPNYSVGTRELALQVLARFGDATDLERLKPLLDETTKCREFDQNQFPIDILRGIHVSEEPPPAGKLLEGKDEAKKKYKLTYRICDIALASSMLIAKEEMKDTFPNFLPHPRFGFDVRSIAVLNEEESQADRSESISTWKENLSARIADLR